MNQSYFNERRIALLAGAAVPLRSQKSLLRAEGDTANSDSIGMKLRKFEIRIPKFEIAVVGRFYV